MATTWTRIDESGTAIEWEQSGLEATENLSHSLLQDLTADDHPQYLTSTRGDALYEALGHGHTNIPITDLNNVNAPSPTNGQILVWVTANGQWEAQDQAAVISVSELNDLTDVQNLTPMFKILLQRTSMYLSMMVLQTTDTKIDYLSQQTLAIIVVSQI
jgi:hypothetical protein